MAKIPISRASIAPVEMGFADDGEEATFSTYEIHIPDILRLPLPARRRKGTKFGESGAISIAKPD